MRKTAIALLALGLVMASTAYASNAVRISQVYGGGGSATATYQYDYVELFNSTGTDVDISGWVVEYASSGTTGSWGSTGSTWNTFVTIPASTTIKACSYFLVRGGGGSGLAPLPVTPDVVGGAGDLNMAAAAGRVGLFSQLFVGPVAGCVTQNLVDLCVYGNSNCPEGAAGAPGLNATLADFRLAGGMTDTDQNGADFVTGAPAPRNSASATNPGCTVIVPAQPTTWGKIKTIYR